MTTGPAIDRGQAVRYHRFKADVLDYWWDGVEWRFEIFVKRGEYRGHWSVPERTLNGTTEYSSTVREV